MLIKDRSADHRCWIRVVVGESRRLRQLLQLQRIQRQNGTWPNWPDWRHYDDGHPPLPSQPLRRDSFDDDGGDARNGDDEKDLLPTSQTSDGGGDDDYPMIQLQIRKTPTGQ